MIQTRIRPSESHEDEDRQAHMCTSEAHGLGARESHVETLFSPCRTTSTLDSRNVVFLRQTAGLSSVGIHRSDVLVCSLKGFESRMVLLVSVELRGQGNFL